jgi:putative ABC transport system permease protein
MNTHYFKMAFQMLRSNPFFAVLSIAAISITVMIVLIMSMQYEMVIASRPPEVNLDRTVILKRGILRQMEQGGMQSSLLGQDLVDYLRSELSIPVAISQMSSFKWNFVSVSGVLKCNLLYTDVDFWKINQFSFISGRPFIPEEVEQAMEVIVISQNIAQKQFGEEEAVGKTIEIIGKPFQIIGVVEDVSSVRRYSHADLYLPYTHNKEGNFAQYLGPYQLLLMAPSAGDIPHIKEEVRAAIRNLAHTLPEHNELTVPGPDTAFEDYFRGWGNEEDVDMASSWLKIVLRLLAIVLVPAINLIAINLTWIAERAREIGLRKAFGATNTTIFRQLLAENTINTLLGGLLGVALTYGVANAFSQLLFRAPWGEQANFAEVSISPMAFLITLASVFFLSLLSGLLPAIRLSRIQPALVLKGGTL